MNSDTIRQQSEAAYKQWAPKWREHAIKLKHFQKKSLQDFENIGVGKAVLCVANGYSFEENIETIKKYKNNVDIIACDKTMGHLLDNGIPPTYVMVCDASVDYARYMEKYKDQLSNTILLINVCANPEWAMNGNWKDIYFFVNKDIINSHDEFSRLSGCTNIIPAGTNVSNAMLIILTLCDNNLKRNFFGYDKILLIGFDYSWKYGGKYYAFDESGNGKTKYMRHAYVTTPAGNFCYTSGNLSFSLEWLTQYINAFKLPVVQCGKDSLLTIGTAKDLESQMQYEYKRHDAEKVRTKVKELRRLAERSEILKQEINGIGRDHFWSYARTT